MGQFKEFCKHVDKMWRGDNPKEILYATLDAEIVTETPDKRLLSHHARSLFTMTLGLVTEAGEAGDCVKKLVRGSGWDIEDFQHELGDVLYYWVKLHQEFGLDPHKTMQMNIAKLSERNKK
jgi:NTP pyrophosphatase (non-canonical NTP hydrolase)